jgi:hypothetical protein
MGEEGAWGNDKTRTPGPWTTFVDQVRRLHSWTTFTDHFRGPLAKHRILVVCMIEFLTVRGKMCMSRVPSLDMIVETQCEVLNPFTI